MRRKHRTMTRAAESSRFAAQALEEGRGFHRRHSELFLLIVAAFLIDGGKAGEFHALVRGAEDMPAAGGLDGRDVVNGVLHLRRDKAAPDELIQPELILRQVVLDQLRIERDIAGADGLVRVLRVLFALVNSRGGGVILRAPGIHNKCLRRRLRLE